MATMQQVADRAGVSIATVSFVVNGNKRVSEDTRARVTA
ncbi:LacI family DNA-binding transcriptional regulator, partial [Paraburkholderia sp. BR14264]